MSCAEIDQALRAILKYGTTNEKIFVSHDVFADMRLHGHVEGGNSIIGAYGFTLPVIVVDHYPDGTIVGWDVGMQRPDVAVER